MTGSEPCTARFGAGAGAGSTETDTPHPVLPDQRVVSDAVIRQNGVGRWVAGRGEEGVQGRWPSRSQRLPAASRNTATLP